MQTFNEFLTPNLGCNTFAVNLLNNMDLVFRNNYKQLWCCGLTANCLCRIMYVFHDSPMLP